MTESSYEAQLIGSLADIEIPKDDHGELVEDFTLESIAFSQDHIANPWSLSQEYGLIGTSFMKILGNSALHTYLAQYKLDTITVTKDSVTGLEALPHEDQSVIESLLVSQFTPAERMFIAAKKNELDEFDDISSGAVKGIMAGAGVGFGLEAIGAHGLGGELLARAGPGMLEASGIAHEFSDKEHTGVMKRWTDSLEDIAENTASPVTRTLAKWTSYGTGLIDDFNNIGLRIIPNVYSVVKNVAKVIASPITYPVKWITGYDIGAEISHHLEDAFPILEDTLLHDAKTTTQRWALSQEKAPYYGLLGLATVRVMNDSARALNMPALNMAMAALESGFVFAINTGNNVVGTAMVYRSYREKGMSRKESLHATYQDPFQIANTVVCGLWYAGELGIRSQGIRPEEQFGQVGAGLESAALSMDTAVAGQIAKSIARRQLVTPAQKSVRYSNLKKLCKEHSASEYLCSLVETTRPSLRKKTQYALDVVKSIAPHVPPV